MQFSVTQLRAFAPLSAAHVLDERTDKTGDAPIQVDELERAVRVVPTEARTVQRLIMKMTASTRGADEGANLAGSVAAAAVSLYAAAVSPVDPRRTTKTGIPRVFGQARNRSAATATTPPLKGTNVVTKPMGLTHLIQAGDKLVGFVGGEHVKKLVALEPTLEVAWSVDIEDPRTCAARPDGSVVVYNRHDSNGFFRVLIVSAEGVKGREVWPDVEPKEIVCAPDGGFFVAGTEGVESYDANGDKRWKFEAEAVLSAITLDEQGRVHVSTREALLVLDDKGKATSRPVSRYGQQSNAPILGSDGTTHLVRHDKGIDIVASDGTLTKLDLTDRLIYPPLMLSDGRLALVRDRSISVVNPDWTEAWSQPHAANAARPVEGPDGTLHVPMSGFLNEKDATQYIASFTPTGERVKHEASVPGSALWRENLLTDTGKLVVASKEGIAIFE